jgi:hypothetical protein
MKKLIVLLSVVLLFACKSENKESIEIGAKDIEAKEEVSYLSFGEKITDEDLLSNKEIVETYNNLKAGDTAIVKFTAKVNEVCQTKGCWMRLDIGGGEAMVKFKDYGFFMPKNIADKEVIVHGKAFVAEISIEEQRHYAEDAGKSKEEITAITEIEKTLSFEADGVLLIE